MNSKEYITGHEPVSLEEDVLDLTDKITNLQQQVSVLSQSHYNNEERHFRSKKENASLLSRIHLLEEQLRDIEYSSDERRKEEEKRYRETMHKFEREQSIEAERFMNKIYNLQQSVVDAKNEAKKCRIQYEKAKEERELMEGELASKVDEFSMVQEELDRTKEGMRRFKEESVSNQRVIDVLRQELTKAKTQQGIQDETLSLEAMNAHDQLMKMTDLEKTILRLQQENRNLQENNEELQAQLLTSRLEEGRCLVREGERVSASLADELVSLSEESSDMIKIKRSLKEQQDVNEKLRAYIDGILLNIVDHYPQLLEVKATN